MLVIKALLALLLPYLPTVRASILLTGGSGLTPLGLGGHHSILSPLGLLGHGGVVGPLGALGHGGIIGPLGALHHHGLLLRESNSEGPRETLTHARAAHDASGRAEQHGQYIAHIGGMAAEHGAIMKDLGNIAQRYSGVIQQLGEMAEHHGGLLRQHGVAVQSHVGAMRNVVDLPHHQLRFVDEYGRPVAGGVVASQQQGGQPHARTFFSLRPPSPFPQVGGLFQTDATAAAYNTQAQDDRKQMLGYNTHLYDHHNMDYGYGLRPGLMLPYHLSHQDGGYDTKQFAVKGQGQAGTSKVLGLGGHMGLG